MYRDSPSKPPVKIPPHDTTEIMPIDMENYPGLGFPVHYLPDLHDRMFPIGISKDSEGAQADILPVNEVAMTLLMDSLTDKVDWNKKVFDQEIVDKWRKEALESDDTPIFNAIIEGKQGDIIKGDHLISPACFDFCIKELQAKAKHFEKTGIIPTLDTCSTVAKADSLIPEDLQQQLRDAFDALQTEQAENPDWHPRSNDMVQDLVHPSMYPLVYGRTRVFQEPCVGVDDAISKWAGKGDIIPKPASHEETQDTSLPIDVEYWSLKYQWLPSNVIFKEDGSMQITSYINNLHPVKHRSMYGVIEKLIEKAVPMWDQVLRVGGFDQDQTGYGRAATRFSRPTDVSEDNNSQWTIPKPVEKIAEEEKLYLEQHPDEHYYIEEEESAALKEWNEKRKPVYPEPDPFEDIDYEATVGLRQCFEKQGLQVIVKMATIELTPEKPEFPAGGWHVEGQMNERICGTVLYYLDSENITESYLSFRQQVNDELSTEMDYAQSEYSYLEHVYGTSLTYENDPTIQYLGKVKTREGRLLAFPNVLQHRVSSFKLADPTKPGHRRFIALWLIDPHIRIISTANVPPQQQSWWLESLLGSSEQSQDAAAAKIPVEVLQLLNDYGNDPGKKMSMLNKLAPQLPLELAEMVRHETDQDALPMTEKEAKEQRLQLMDERTKFMEKSNEDRSRWGYNFCEH